MNVPHYHEPFRDPDHDGFAEDVLNPARWRTLQAARDKGNPRFLSGLVELFLCDARGRLDRIAAFAHRGDARRGALELDALQVSCEQIGARAMTGLCCTLGGAMKVGLPENADLLQECLEEEFQRVRKALLQS